MKKKRIIIVCSIALAMLITAGFGLQQYWMHRQAQIVLPQPIGHSVTRPQDEAAGDMGYRWLESLLQGYQQPFIRSADRVRDYTIDSLAVLDESGPLVVQANFSFEARDTAPFTEWQGGFDGTRWHCEWVIVFDAAPGTETEDEEVTIIYTATDIMRPAAYDLLEQNANGQIQQDELWQENRADRPANPDQAYKIENGTCFVTYDEGGTWVETPLPLEQLDYYVDGQQRTNSLQPGSFFISPQTTAILLGGVNTPLSVLYSDDAGNSWHTYTVEGAPEGITRKFVSFPDGEHGFMAVGSDKTMNWEMCSLFQTSDGGQTWQYVREGPGDHAILSFAFFDADCGFISYSNGYGAIDICRSLDGGVNWYTVTIEVADDLQPYFTRAEAPYMEDSTLVLLVGEDEMSDYSARQNHYLRYTSEDGGTTWLFDEIIEKEVFILG